MFWSSGTGLRGAREALSGGNIAAARGALAENPGGDALAQKIAGEAESLLDAGLTGEAAARIDLYLHPKFSSVADCRARYRKAMEARS